MSFELRDIVDLQGHTLLLLQSSHFWSSPITITVGLFLLLLVWRLWRFTISPMLYPNEAREFPYWIPLLGHTIPFFLDSTSIFTRGKEYFQNSRKPFVLTVAGSSIYVLTSAADAAVMSKNSNELNFDDFIRDMMDAVGFTSEGISKMFQPRIPTTKVKQDAVRYPNPMGKPMGHLSEEIFRKQLQPGNHLNDLQDRFLTSIHQSLTWDKLAVSPNAVLSSSPGEHTVSLVQWIQTVLLGGATTAFFGDALLKLDPRLLDSFSEFDARSWQLIYRVPDIWSKKMRAAKQKALDALNVYFTLPMHEKPGACWLVRTMENELRASEFRTGDMAASLLMSYWVINANAWKVCFWMMAYLVQDPNLYKTIRDEVAPILAVDKSPNEISDCLDRCPWLVAVYQETLRMVASSVAVRNVLKPFEIGGIVLRPGTRVLVPYRQLLLDEAVFGEDAAYFNPARFINNKNLAKSLSFKPFGSGMTHCPGRFLAQKEILTFIGVALSRFDVSKEPGTSATGAFPRLELKKPCLGIMGPVSGDDCIVKVKPLTGTL